jgi:hypothetical protein
MRFQYLGRSIADSLTRVNFVELRTAQEKMTGVGIADGSRCDCMLSSNLKGRFWFTFYFVFSWRKLGNHVSMSAVKEDTDKRKVHCMYLD